MLYELESRSFIFGGTKDRALSRNTVEYRLKHKTVKRIMGKISKKKDLLVGHVENLNA